MKKIVLFLVLAVSPVALADDSAGGNLLQNGDFSSGVAHWEGDCHSPTSDEAAPDFSSNPMTTTPTSGVLIKLRHEDWTKMTQDFDGKVGDYTLTVSYSLSSDAKLSTSPDDYANIPGANGFTLFPPFAGTPGKWMIIISDLGAWRFSQYEVKPGTAAADGTQTFTAPVKLNSDDSQKKGLIFVFPPGQGIITIKSVSLVPQQGQ